MKFFYEIYNYTQFELRAETINSTQPKRFFEDTLITIYKGTVTTNKKIFNEILNYTTKTINYEDIIETACNYQILFSPFYFSCFKRSWSPVWEVKVKKFPWSENEKKKKKKKN